MNVGRIGPPSSNNRQIPANIRQSAHTHKQTKGVLREQEQDASNRLEQRLVSFQDELLDRLQTTAMATPNKKHMGAPGPLWASSMEEPRAPLRCFSLLLSAHTGSCLSVV